MNFLDIIGFNGFAILFVINCYFLIDQKSYFVIFCLFYLINYYIILIGKVIFKSPRPRGYLDSQYDDGGIYTNNEMYGMPSGHSSFVFYCTMFHWLVKQDVIVLMVELFIAALTVYQRWKYKKHTLEQLFVGGIIGIMIAFFSVEITKRWKKKYV